MTAGLCMSLVKNVLQQVWPVDCSLYVRFSDSQFSYCHNGWLVLTYWNQWPARLRSFIHPTYRTCENNALATTLSSPFSFALTVPSHLLRPSFTYIVHCTISRILWWGDLQPVCWVIKGTNALGFDSRLGHQLVTRPYVVSKQADQHVTWFTRCFENTSLILLLQTRISGPMSVFIRDVTLLSLTIQIWINCSTFSDLNCLR